MADFGLVALAVVGGVGAVFALRRFLRWRRSQRVQPPRPVAFCVKDPVGTFYGARYPRPGAPPVLLIHGYGGNSRNWKEMGHALHAGGYDVWMANLRGHGQGHHRSSAHSGRYGFRYFVTEDIPILVNHVFEQTARRLFLVGHSLGGVASLSFVGGVREGADGNLMVDEGQMRYLASRRIESLVCLGSPPHFKAFPRSLAWMVARPAGLIEMLQKVLLHSKADPLKPKRGLVTGVRGKVIGQIDRSLKKLNPVRGILEVANFDSSQGEFQRLLEKGLSPAPKDLTQDINRWVGAGEIVAEDGFAFIAPRKIGVPVLFVSGELDGLGPAAAIRTQVEQLQPHGRFWEATVSATSHVDLISGQRAAHLVAPILHRFFERPSQLGPPGSRTEIRPG